MQWQLASRVNYLMLVSFYTILVEGAFMIGWILCNRRTLARSIPQSRYYLHGAQLVYHEAFPVSVYSGKVLIV